MFLGEPDVSVRCLLVSARPRHRLMVPWVCFRTGCRTFCRRVCRPVSSIDLVGNTTDAHRSVNKFLRILLLTFLSLASSAVSISIYWLDDIKLLLLNTIEIFVGIYRVFTLFLAYFELPQNKKFKRTTFVPFRNS